MARGEPSGRRDRGLPGRPAPSPLCYTAEMETLHPHDPDTQELLQRVRRRSTRRRRLQVLGIVGAALIAVGGLTALAVAGLHERASTSAAVTRATAQSTTQAPTTASPRTTSPIPPTTAPAARTGTTGAPPTTRGAATSTTTSGPPGSPTSAASRGPLAFDATRAMAHVKQLAVDLGVRTGGTGDEAAAARYTADYLQGLGYSVAIVAVALPNGRVSHNVRAVKVGASAATILLGAHVDSKAPSPGANDNASGVAVVLELARDLREADTVATVELVLFGTEEMIDTERNHHHYGSRAFVKNMTSTQRGNLAGMISVDMVASGDILTVGTMDGARRGSPSCCRRTRAA